MAAERIAALGMAALKSFALRRFALTLTAVLASGTALAQSPEPHGIGGFWNMARGPLPPRREPTATEAELMTYFPDDAVVLGDAGSTEFPPGIYGGLAVHADLVEAARDYDPYAQTTVSLTCKPPGMIYSMQGPFPIEIFEGRDLIVVKLEYFDLVRIIFMNETEHPAGWPLSQSGHSIGHWEGDTLVVDTVALAPATLFNNGVEHSDQIHLLERFRLADADTMIVTQQFEDPGSFAGTAARVLSFNRGDDHVYPYDCDPSYGIDFQAIEGPDGD